MPMIFKNKKLFHTNNKTHLNTWTYFNCLFKHFFPIILHLLHSNNKIEIRSYTIRLYSQHKNPVLSLDEIFETVMEKCFYSAGVILYHLEHHVIKYCKWAIVEMSTLSKWTIFTHTILLHVQILVRKVWSCRKDLKCNFIPFNSLYRTNLKGQGDCFIDVSHRQR